MSAVTIPVMAKCRVGHFAEAQILESLEVDCIDESEGVAFYVISCSEKDKGEGGWGQHELLHNATIIN